MPSFPGMDPWLEAADIWPDFHDSFAGEIRNVLNQTLPPPYYARLEMRSEIGVVDNDTGEGYARRVAPDVAVANSARAGHASGAGVAVAAPRTEISQSVEIVKRDEEGRHLLVEIRDPRRPPVTAQFIYRTRRSRVAAAAQLSSAGQSRMDARRRQPLARISDRAARTTACHSRAAARG